MAAKERSKRMSAQATWISELPEVNHNVSFEVEDATPAKVALDSDELHSSGFPRIIGKNAALRRVLDMVQVVGPTDATVLIKGETGTGKELIAEAIHKCSDRSNGPFVKVNCSAIPAGLLESELFGHERGAFTGAVARGIGRFERAHRGTLFLDEIGDLLLELQPKLLRVIQERQFERLGGASTIHTDVRVICATHRNLVEMVDEREFRADLFYRLSVFPIELPPLRDRPDDVLLLAKYFIDRYATKAGKNIRNIERKTVEWLQAYDWPGNIRELQNVVERAVILCDGETFAIDETWLRPEPRGASWPQVPRAATLVNKEREMIETALEESHGRISGPSGAAGKLGMPRTTLESKIRSLRIDKHQFKCARA
jgi:transcriptional regulator with GAF, ATPase, and Fis domain